MNTTGWLVVSASAGLVMAAMITVPAALRAPDSHGGGSGRGDKMTAAKVPVVRTIPITKPESPPANHQSEATETQPVKMQPEPMRTKAEPEPDPEPRRNWHVGTTTGGSICTRTGGWKVDYGKSWRCAYIKEGNRHERRRHYRR